MNVDGDGGGGNGGFEKVTICHEGGTIEVAPEALEAHYSHGDTLGPCEESARDPADAVEMVLSDPVIGEPVEAVQPASTEEATTEEVPAEEAAPEESGS